MTTQTNSIRQTGTTPPSFFETAPYIAPDAVFALTAEYNADTFPQKVNLGQGTYRDENGQPWVLPSVRKSRELLVEQGLNHEYLPILGLQAFRQEASKMALGSGLYEKIQSRVGINLLEFPTSICLIVSSNTNKITPARNLPRPLRHWISASSRPTPPKLPCTVTKDIHPQSHMVKPSPSLFLSRVYLRIVRILR